MTTRRELLSSTLPTALAAVGGSAFALDSILAAAPVADGAVGDAFFDLVLPQLRLDGTPFVDVLELFRNTTKTNLDVDWKAIEGAGIDKNVPISMRLDNVKVSKALDLVLRDASGPGADAKLGYVFGDGVLTISTVAALPANRAVAGAAGYFATSNFFDAGEWKLPKLPYGYDALEPHIDARTMELHHTKHHQAYVTNLNKALKAMKELPDDAEPRTIEGLQRDISFNMGGHALHSIFWGTMGKDEAGKMGGEPIGALADLINTQFGSFAKFAAYFTKIATSLKGSGWAVLAYSPYSKSLLTFAVKDQDAHHAVGTITILGIDVWEHAYYLTYQNDRAAYVKAWWNTINWSAVEKLLA